MRILLMCSTLNAGGAERTCVLLAGELASRGHEVHLSTAFEPGCFASQLEPQVELCVLGSRGDSLVQRVAALRREILSFRPEVCHGFVGGTKYGAITARLCGHRAVVSSEQSAFGGASRAFIRKKRFCAKWPHMVAVNSQGVYRFFHETCGVAARRLCLIPNFVPVRQFPNRDPGLRAEVRAELGLAEGEVAFIAVGRLHPVKAPDQLLAAAAALQESHPQARWFLAGEGELADRLRQSIAAQGLADLVTLLGRRGDIPRLLQGMDVFLIPSLWEGMPNALLEAMAAGLPAIGTRVAGTEELILAGETGWLVPVGDTGALVDATVAAMAGPTALAQMGQAARTRAELAYDQPVVVDSYLALYERLLGR